MNKITPKEAALERKITLQEKIKELKEAMEYAVNKCKHETEADGNKGACLDYHGYFENKKLLEQLQNEDAD
jgi:hypothetical protein